MQPKMHLIHSNNNYKVICRVRQQIEESAPMIDIHDNNVSIKDPSNKNSNEKQVFNFSSVFDYDISQDLLFKYVCDHSITKIIEGHNSCIISYGQTGSGKTYTIFGEDEKYTPTLVNLFQEKKKDRRGLVPKTVEFLFKRAKELEEIREFVITCSMVEIYLDQVRDLGKAYLENNGNKEASGALQVSSVVSNFETESLEIFENSNGQIMIRNLTYVTIKNMEDLYCFLNAGFKLRDRFDNKENHLWARAHTIFTINLVQKDKENENLPFMNATIQFADLAGSERIAKSLTEGHKFQEAILINSSLTAVGKCLLCIAQSSSKNIPYRESRLTRALQNCLSSICHIMLIANVNPHEKNFEECLSTLQFAERTKNIDVKTKQGGILEEVDVLNRVGSYNSSEKVLKKLNDELNEIRVKTDNFQREYRQKLIDLQKLLGLEIELDKLISKPNDKDLKNFRAQRLALGELDNFKKEREDLFYKIERNKHQIEDMEKEEFQKQERLISQILEMREQNKRLSEQIQIIKMNSKDGVRNVEEEKKKDIENLNANMKVLLLEKDEYLLNLPPEQKLKKKNENHDYEKQDTKDLLEKINYKNPFSADLEKLKMEYDKLLEKMKEKYDYFIKLKQEDIEKYDGEFKKKKNKIKNELKEIKVELLDIYEIIMKQNKILTKIESGQFSAGIKSFKIPSKEKTNLPNRKNHNTLFQLLDEKHLNHTKTNKDETNINSIHEGQKQQRSPDSIHNATMGDEQDTIEEDKIDINNVDLNESVKSLEKGRLKEYTIKLKKLLKFTLEKEKDLRKKIQQFDEAHQGIDINTLLKERDEYKQNYIKEIKNSQTIKSTIETQQKLMITKKFEGTLNKIKNNSSMGFFNPKKTHFP